MSRTTYSSSFNNWLNEKGEVFKTIGDHDSGNMSYGIRMEDRQRHFVKFAPFENETAIGLLENAIIIGKTIEHHTLTTFQFAVECSDGLALVYEWVDGESINEITNATKHIIKELRSDPKSPYRRLRLLPVDKIISILNQIFDLHVLIEQNGYVSCDWYDGCLIYDFENDVLHIMDLDTYNKGLFKNTMGRMYGSSRFMAPEEFSLGETIDFQTTVYHMGATVFELLGTGKKDPSVGFRGSKELFNVAMKAIQPNKEDRHSSVQEFYTDWISILDANSEK